MAQYVTVGWHLINCVRCLISLNVVFTYFEHLRSSRGGEITTRGDMCPTVSPTRYRFFPDFVRPGFKPSDLSIYLSIDRSNYLSIYLSIDLSIDLSIYRSIYRSIYPRVHDAGSTPSSIDQSIDRSIDLSIDRSIYRSTIDLSIYRLINLSIDCAETWRAQVR